MVFYYAWRLVNSTTAFLYPTYASYKALCRRPADEAELERWLMYWSVVGVIVAFEYSAEWLISWIPLYYLVKTLFLLYLALPKAQGAAFIYTTQLRPVLQQYEPQIDAAFSSLYARLYEWASEKVNALWRTVVNAPPPARAQTIEPPTVQHPATVFQGLWAAYGPTVVAGAAALLRNAQPQAPAQAQGESTLESLTPPVQPSRGLSDDAAVLRRRRELEAELASLRVPSPGGSSAGDTTRFEEVDPEDASGDESVGSPVRPGDARRGSWWGWGGTGGAYSKVKTD
ncbi:hypothetical protein AURDEDRAFT_146734 [Auricularia subglabra TFB-10046 SS5]|nr:hypothetical protein AURDEDRAFT_146734 [Auricularia subglabra TFB-10046 SS5]